ncbi:MAG: hypothetical protein OHK0013_24150 [Sandaracinaceae bacterium]
MARARVALAFTAILGGCCFTPPAPVPFAPPPAPTVVEGGGPRLPSTSPVEAMPISLGFADPLVLHGLAGGIREASAFGPDCRGRVATTPSRRFLLETSFPYLRIMARGERDLTLVVRTPGGTARCNDDSDGLNPVVEGAFEPGIYDVYVGVYSGSELAPYDLGLSVNASITPTTMHAATPTPTGTTLRSGTLTVTEVEGSVVSVGDVCSFSELSIPPTSDGHDVRWTITCGTSVLYGAGDTGYGRVTDPSWPPGTIAYDHATSAEDTDPALEWTSDAIVLRDDASGPFGAYRIRFAAP